MIDKQEFNWFTNCLMILIKDGNAAALSELKDTPTVHYDGKDWTYRALLRYSLSFLTHFPDYQQYRQTCIQVFS